MPILFVISRHEYASPRACRISAPMQSPKPRRPHRRFLSLASSASFADVSSLALPLRENVPLLAK